MVVKQGRNTSLIGSSPHSKAPPIAGGMENPVRELVRSFKAYPTVTLGSVVLWGVLEFVALQRSQMKARMLPKLPAQ